MNHTRFLSLLPGTAREDLDALCMPGLVPVHGETDSMATRFPALAPLLDPLKASRRLYAGKVRDRIDLGDRVLLCTSDRVSAFDVILGLVPCKGEVLNGISSFWFDRTRDIIPNHIIRTVGQRGVLGRKAKVLPVEVVVRGYLTGSAWRDYQAGRDISGIRLPAGMRKDQAFPAALITPSTKEDLGSHDQPISCAEIVKQGLVAPDIWHQVEQAALKLFARGQEEAANRGLILVDTKYEFGIATGASGPELILVDEIHTPDSSRYWYADTYPELFEKGAEQRKLDKEYLRQWLMDMGWSGKGNPPDIPGTVIAELAWRYIQAFQELTGQEYEPKSWDLEQEARALESVLREEGRS